MAETYVIYTTTQGQDTYIYTFPSISTDHIFVSVDGVDEPGFTVVEDVAFNSIILDTPSPESGLELIISRTTPLTPSVDFGKGSVYTTADLVLANKQGVYACDEFRERMEKALADGSGYPAETVTLLAAIAAVQATVITEAEIQTITNTLLGV